MKLRNLQGKARHGLVARCATAQGDEVTHEHEHGDEVTWRQTRDMD